MDDAGVSALPPLTSSRGSPVATSITVVAVVPLPTMGSEASVEAMEFSAAAVGAGASASSPDGVPDSSAGGDGVG